MEKTWEANDLFGLKGHRVFEYGIGWTDSKAKAEAKPMNWRWISYLPELPVDTTDPRIVAHAQRTGDMTEYEVCVPWAALGLQSAPKPGSSIGFSLTVNDADPGKKSVRRGLQLFNGVSDGKDQKKFGQLWLR